MEHTPRDGQAAVPESVIRIAKCFDYLMSEVAGLRDEIEYPDGQHITSVRCAEPTMVAPEEDMPLYGRRFSASITTVPTVGQHRVVYEAWALVDDRAIRFDARLPLRDDASGLNRAELAKWKELKRQKVLMILSVLLHDMFEVEPDETI